MSPHHLAINLSKIEPDSEFWIAAHHGLQPLITYPVEFALRDPKQYGNGVPDGVFTKILNGMLSGALDEVSTVNALTAFSAYCTEEEWTQWYRPVLDKKLRLPCTITEFNKACPKEYRIECNPTPALLVPVAKAKGLPQKYLLEPHRDAQRLLILMQRRKAWVFTEDGTPVHRMLPKVFERFTTEDGVMLEVYEENEKYIARDIMLWSQFVGEIPCPPVDVRLSVLERMLDGQDIVEMIEYTNSKDPREDIAAWYQSGYHGVIFRATGCEYHHEHANILIHPKRKSVLTVTKVDQGSDDGKYADRAEFVWGKGTMDRKKFDSPVFHGLTFADRETILKSSDEYIGRKFEALSCGLDSNGRLIFPIFKQWKEQK
ncbi:MAG: hypothetical protein DRQ39_08155 [Gammaproteobacteria bacterium]|nr:MAG: hypothetical protein DRQ39_08155 [Gammaproteobacteria bacterium]